MTTPIHNAEFSFTFSLIIGSSFSFNLCPSDLLLLLQPVGCKTTFLGFFLHQYAISFHILTEDTVSHDFLLLLVCLFFWLFCYKTEENTVEYIRMASAILYGNTSLYCQRCITGDFLSCLEHYSSQS